MTKHNTGIFSAWALAIAHFGLAGKLTGMVNDLRRARLEGRHRRITARLSAKILHDIGEADIRPISSTAGNPLNTAELMRMRSF